MNSEVGGEETLRSKGRASKLEADVAVFPARLCHNSPELTNSSQVGRFSTTSVVKGKAYAQIFMTKVSRMVSFTKGNQKLYGDSSSVERCA